MSWSSLHGHFSPFDDFWVHNYVNAGTLSAVRFYLCLVYAVISHYNFISYIKLIHSEAWTFLVNCKTKSLGNQASWLGDTLHTKTRIRHFSLYAYAGPYSSPVNCNDLIVNSVVVTVWLLKSVMIINEYAWAVIIFLCSKPHVVSCLCRCKICKRYFKDIMNSQKRKSDYLFSWSLVKYLKQMWKSALMLESRNRIIRKSVWNIWIIFSNKIFL